MCFFPMKPFGHIVSEISSRRITTEGDEDEDVVVVGAVAPNNAESIGEYGGEAVDLHLAEYTLSRVVVYSTVLVGPLARI